MSFPITNKPKEDQDKALEASSSKSPSNPQPRSTSGIPRLRSTVSRNLPEETASLTAISPVARRKTVESKSLKRDTVQSDETLPEANEVSINDPQWIHPLLLIEASKNYRETVLRDRVMSSPPLSLATNVPPSDDLENQSDHSVTTSSQSGTSVTSDSPVATSPSLTVLHTSPSVLLRSILKQPALTEDEGRCGDTILSVEKKVRWRPEVDVIYYAGDTVVERTSEKLADEHKTNSIYTRAPSTRISSIDRCPFDDPFPLKF